MRIFALAFLCGILLLYNGGWLGYLLPRWELPNTLENKPLEAEGMIATIPADNPHYQSFLFKLSRFNHQPAKGLVKLSWQKPQPLLHVGDQWRLQINLKRIHAVMNPGGFDSEALALQTGLCAHGYVVPHSHYQLLTSHWYHYPIHRLREHLKQKIETTLKASKTSPWIVALALGERQGIPQEYWDVLRNTGTNHLMAIAGLHIGCMSGFAHGLASWLWRRSPALLLRIPALHVGVIAALVMAVIYSGLAGFSIPTQRACIMLAFFLVAVLMRRKIPAWQAWCGALLLVLLMNPWDVLSESFWLSFGSVALIIYGVSGRIAPSGWWWKYGRIQWVVALGLIPLGIALFQQFSLVSFVANTIAIPWVAFLVVPLTLLGSFTLMFSIHIGGGLLWLADKLLSVLWSILTHLAQLPLASWDIVVSNHWVLGVACLGVVLLLAPQGMPGRYLGFLWLLPLIFYKPHAPSPGEVWFTLLDVGQGLSAVVQTEQHILVFDTGPGGNIVVPFLRSLAAKRIDKLVVSHGDFDHIGGAAEILKQMPVLTINTSVPDKLPGAQYCLRGQHWEWDGVKFEFLYPTQDNLNLDNDSSCVLRVSTDHQHILLTGDIEKYAEIHLVNEQKDLLKADILVAPHHGSTTSDLDEFVHAVQPNIVLFPVGYLNRFHFPHARVIEKYQALNAQLFDTVKSGAIQIKINAKDDTREIIEYRKLKAMPKSIFSN